VSYDLAVWDGARPKTDAEAATTFEVLYAQARQAETPAEPTPAIRRYVEALLARYPDMDDDNEDECPWADAPLINNAIGPLFYFAMVFSKAETASAVAAELARAHGLVCFDPQAGTLR
jgi:hypothetical protein